MGSYMVSTRLMTLLTTHVVHFLIIHSTRVYILNEILYSSQLQEFLSAKI